MVRSTRHAFDASSTALLTTQQDRTSSSRPPERSRRATNSKNNNIPRQNFRLLETAESAVDCCDVSNGNLATVPPPAAAAVGVVSSS